MDRGEKEYNARLVGQDFPGSASLPIFSASSPRAAREDGEWRLWSVHHRLSLPLLPLHGEDSSHSVPAPVWGPSHGRQFSTSFSNVRPSHGVQRFTNCSRVGPPWGHKSCQKTCSTLCSSLHGTTGPARSLLQHRLPTVSQPPSGIHLLLCGVLHGLQVDISSTTDLHGLQGGSLPHRGLLHGLQVNLCSGACTTCSPSFFTDLGVCRVVSLTKSHSFLWLQIPHLKYVLTEALPLSLMGSALASGGSVLELAGIGSVGHGDMRGSF